VPHNKRLLLANAAQCGGGGYAAAFSGCIGAFATETQAVSHRNVRHLAGWMYGV